MEMVKDKTFNSERVTLDDKDFIDCQFRNCELVYSGGLVSFLETAISGCRWSFGGPAHRTINLLQCFGLELPADPLSAALHVI